MTSRSKIARQIRKDIEEGIECNFSLYTAESYKSQGITTIVSVGKSQDPETYGESKLIRYAVCPVCNKKGKTFGLYYSLHDAISCVAGHQFIDPEEDQREKELNRARQKAHNVFLFSTVLMARKYAIISKSRTLAENFVRDNRIEEYIVINSIDDLIKVSDHQFVFLGRPSNYLTHPALKDPDVRAELERQECVRDWEFAVFKNGIFTLVDKYDLEDFEGEVYVRTQIAGQPCFVKRPSNTEHNLPE